MSTPAEDILAAVGLLTTALAKLRTPGGSAAATDGDVSAANGNPRGDASVRLAGGKSYRVTLSTPGICNRCDGEVLWSKTVKNGKNVPLEPEPDDQGYYTSHFARCKP